MKFLQGSVSKDCDIFLDELKAGLEATCGKTVSTSTIWRALQRSGYTMKKVHHLTNCNYVLW